MKEYNSEVQKLKRDLAVQIERVNDLTIEKQSIEDQFHICRQVLKNNERDDFYKEYQKAQLLKQKVQEIVQTEVKKAKDEERSKFEKSMKEMELFKEKNQELLIKVQQLEQDNQNKDLQMKKLRSEFKQLSKKQEGVDFDEEQWEKDQKEMMEEATSLRKKLNKEKQRFNDLSEKMDNILAENRVLRRLAKVSENYGFNLEEIKIAEKQKIEDYKAQVRYLEREVEELEGERMQLRNRLRILSNIYDQNPRGDRYLGLTQQELQLVDEFVANLKNKIKVKVSQDDTKTQLIKQIKELEDQVRRCQIEHVERDKDTDKGKSKAFNDKDIQKILEQNNDLKKALELITQQLQVLQKNKQTVNVQSQENQQQNVLDINQKGYPMHLQHLSKPPQPLPGALGNWDDISQVRSYKFKQNIPAEIFELYSEGGFNQTLAKYQIAQLQVMNIEMIKILQEKEKEYSIVQSELEEMKEQLTRCLLIQDNLYEKHYEAKTSLEEKIKVMEHQLNDKTCEIQRLNEELSEYKNINQISQNSDKDKLKQKLAEMTQKISIMDVNLIKLSRKYSCLKDEYQELSETYKNYSVEFDKKENLLIEKIQGLIEWKKKAQHYVKLLLTEIQDSVHKSKFNILRNRFDKQQDELANIKEKNTNLLSEIHKLKNSERQLFEKNEKIRILEDETLEIQLELQMTKKMLEIVDPHYRKYQIAYQKLVDVMISKNISPAQIFSQIDDNRDGFLGPAEFQQAMNSLNLDFKQQEVEILFRFMDFDGNNKIELKEFTRKLRRSGVTIRKSQEILIYDLWEKIQQAGLSLGETFKAFDKDGSGEVSKDEMYLTLKALIKNIDEETVSYIFHMADTSGDGKITYSEFHSLFENIISDVMRQQLLMSVEDLSWQKQVILKIDEAIHSQGQYIKDLYQLLDNNDDDEIDFTEFKSLFQKLQLDVADEELRQLFADIDIDSNGSIEYNELINYIRSAKVEKMKIEKMKRVSQKIDAMQKQGQLREVDIQDIQNLPKEARLEMKINLLEIKDKNINSRCDMLMYQLNLTEKMNAKLNLQLKDRENEIIQQIKKYNEVQKLYHRALNMLEGCETKQLSKQIHVLNKKLLKEATELRVQNKNLRNLHEFASNQVKDLLISHERKKYEYETLQDTVKELQSISDEKAIVGKLQHSLMIARYSQSQTNIKYDNLVHDLEKYQQQLQQIEQELNEANQDSIESREVLRQKIYDYEDTITDLRSKILPTINISKIDDMYRRINELSTMKTDLEILNKKLRDDNHELAIKCDYFEALEQQFDELKNDLRQKYNDQLQQRVIELSIQVSEQKLMEMKAKRDQEIAKEKEEYYQRITRQHLEHVKALEQELELLNKKFNEREQFWRQKHQEAMNMIMNDKENKEKDKRDDPIYKLRMQAGKTNKLIDTVQMGNTRQNVKTADGKTATGGTMHKGVKYINDLEAAIGNEENEEIIEKYKKEIEAFKEKQVSLYDEIDRLKEYVNSLKGTRKGSNIVYVENDGQRNNIMNEENEKIAIAAQKSITALRGLIDDKIYELERKDLLIQNMKKDFQMEKERDAAEIRKLLMQIGQNSGRNEFQNNYSQLLRNEEESNKTKAELENQVDNLQIKMKIQQKRIEELEDLIKRLEDELIIARQNAKVNELEDQIKALQKLLKENNKVIQELKKQKEALSKDYKESIEQSLNKEDDYKKKILQLKKDNKDLQGQVKDALDSINRLKREADHSRNTNQKVEIQNLMKREQELKKKEQDIQKEKPVGISSQKENELQRLLDKEKSEHTKTKDKLKQFDIQAKELQETIKHLSKEKYSGIYDSNNYLKPQGKMSFENANEIGQTIKIYLQNTPHYDLFKDIKSQEERKQGFIFAANLQRIFDSKNINLRPEDFKLLVHETQRLENKGQQDIKIDIMKLYYVINNLSEQQTETDFFSQQRNQQEQQSQKVSENFDLERLTYIQDKEKLSQKEEELQKRNDMLKIKLQNMKEEKDKTQRLLDLKNEQCKMLEQQLKKIQNKTSKGGADKQDTFNNFDERSDSIQQLKKNIFNLEEQNSKLEQVIINKDLELKKAREDYGKQEEQIKQLKVLNMKTKNQLDNALSNKLQPEQLKDDALVQKDLLIRELKEKLDKARSEEKSLIDRLFMLEKQNKELIYVKENFDGQIERLNRRIAELQENQGGSNYVKFSNDINKQQQSTLKKTVPKK